MQKSTTFKYLDLFFGKSLSWLLEIHGPKNILTTILFIAILWLKISRAMWALYDLDLCDKYRKTTIQLGYKELITFSVNLNFKNQF